MKKDSGQNVLVDAVTQNDHVLGPESAKVTILEYGDFECPSCGQAYPAVKMQLQHFADRVRFVYRHFPLREVHPHAELAAEAAETAAVQGKFWQMHDLLFENQLHLNARTITRLAADAGLDLQRYLYEMGHNVYRDNVQRHVDSGNRNGVRSTPTFYVNGIVCDVSFGLEHLRRAVEAELAA